MEIAIAGAGYVGLTSAACFCELGHHVRLVEINKERLAVLQKRECPLFEPGLPELLQRHLGRNLIVTDHLSEAIAGAGVLFVCVGTPPLPDGEPDLSALHNLLQDLGMSPRPDELILTLKSTVPPGTCRMAFEYLQGRMPVVSNPEFLREGTAIADFFHPDRIVAGSTDENAALTVAGLYRSINAPLLITGWEESELIKYASNAFLAIKVSFANEIAALCDGIRADASEVLQGVGLDQRIGTLFLRPGPGYGGSCLPKDIRALCWRARRAAVELDLVPAAERVNLRQRLRLLHKLSQALGGLSGKQVAVWGLAFKADTDDLRGAASLEIIPRLLREGTAVRVYDPAAMVGFSHQMQAEQGRNLTLCSTPEEAIQDADGLLILTEWEVFRLFSPAEIASKMSGNVVVDGRNLMDPDAAEAAGLRYQGIGRGRVR